MEFWVNTSPLKATQRRLGRSKWRALAPAKLPGPHGHGLVRSSPHVSRHPDHRTQRHVPCHVPTARPMPRPNGTSQPAQSPIDGFFRVGEDGARGGLVGCKDERSSEDTRHVGQSVTHAHTHSPPRPLQRGAPGHLGGQANGGRLGGWWKLDVFGGCDVLVGQHLNT